MTDSSQLPFDHLDIQSTIYFDIPEKESLVPYLHLICFSEEHFNVQPYDLEFLCKLYNYDTRRLIDTLQLWLHPQSHNDNLFARIMGFQDLLFRKGVLMELLDRLKGTSEKTIELCLNYYFTTVKEEKEEVMGMEHVLQMMDTASFADAWIGLTEKQRHQVRKKKKKKGLVLFIV